MNEFLPVGKLAAELLRQLINQAEAYGVGAGRDPSVWLGPGIGIDCAVLDIGERLLVLKSDPITFAVQDIGWYVVHVNANDIACMGASPRWLLTTVLLPEGSTSAKEVERLAAQIYQACAEIDVTVIGGHTEITHGLDRPLLTATLIGEVDRERLITPLGARPGDRLLLTKGVPIEATTLLAREFPDRLDDSWSATDIARACDYLHDPGISVLRDAMMATKAGTVHAMHDPTEGGLYTAVWEMAEASGCSLWIEREKVLVPELAGRICEAFGLDPLAAIASGALLMAVPESDEAFICNSLIEGNVPCSCIGELREGPMSAWIKRGMDGYEPMPRPHRDAIAQVFESNG